MTSGRLHAGIPSAASRSSSSNPDNASARGSRAPRPDGIPRRSVAFASSTDVRARPNASRAERSSVGTRPFLRRLVTAGDCRGGSGRTGQGKHPDTIEPLSDLVVLRIAATTGHVGLARATATAMAARLDFTYDRLTDLHIAIDEVCGRVLATSDPPAVRLELTFEPGPDGLTVSVASDGRLKSGTQFLTPESQRILD